MDPVDYDIYIGYRRDIGTELADRLASALTGRGFRVRVGHREGEPADQPLLNVAEQAADFVLLLGAGTLEPALRDEHDALRLELARAFGHDRNVIPVALKGYVPPEPGSLPADLATLERAPLVTFEPTRSAESIARVVHRLTSHATLDDRKSNRQAKGIGWLVAVFVLAVIAVGGYRTWKEWQKPVLDERPLPPFVVYWTTFGQHLDGGRWVEFPVQDASPMSAGDQFKLVFSANADGYAYVVSRETSGQVNVLFPSKMLGKASRVKAGETYDAPVGSGWSDAGGSLDALYLVAGHDPIENLEALVEEHAEESTPQARQALLESTIAGLLDGRHAMAGPVIRTRSGRPVVRTTETDPTVTSASATLSSGIRVTHALAAQRGLQSAAVELHFKR
jgi:hypothetical protein